MGFQDKLKKTVSKGIEQSRHIFSAAKDKARELGDAGILRFEIHQLEDKLKKQEQLLGSTVYSLFTEEGKQSLTKRSAGVKEVIETMDDLNSQITSKRAALKDAEAVENGQAAQGNEKDAGTGSTLKDSPEN